MRAEERVSLFFINRPIKQGRRLSPAPASMFYFVRPLSRAHARFLLPRLRPLLLAAFSLVSFGRVPFFPSCRESLPFRPPFDLSRETLPPAAKRRTLCRAGPGAVLFLLFYSTFSREGGILLLPGRATPVFSEQ